MKSKEALFIIDSPFQALCAFDAIFHYGISEAHFAIQEDDVVAEKTLPLICQKGKVHILKKEKAEISTMKWVKRTRDALPKTFHTVFIGDYYSYWQYLVASFATNFKAEMIYLDDGNSTLSIIPPESRTRGFGRGKLWFGILDFYNNVRFIKKHLYTIFDLGDHCPIPYTYHDFSALTEKNIKSCTKKGVYVIGINSEKVVLRNSTYKNYLLQLNAWINKNFASEPVYFCPHRMDPTDFKPLIKQLDWKLFHTQNSVEIDFFRQGIMPLLIIGFGSTALYTLKKMYPNSDVKTVSMDFEDEELNVCYQAIEVHYRKQGIETLTLSFTKM